MIRRQLTYRLMKLRPKGVVLMYHRIGEPDTDAWQLSVSPENFRQQLAVLKKQYTPLSLQRLVRRRRSWIPRRHVAITFDDGYRDNFLQAAPLLEEAGLPASFFISSGFTGTKRWFWWDALEYLLLQHPELPSEIALNIGTGSQKFSLAGEEQLSPQLRQRLKGWQAEQPAPGKRAEAYLVLWKHLQKQPAEAQQELLDQLYQQAGLPYPQERLCMSKPEVQALQEHPLFTVEAHTRNHPLLAECTPELQHEEIAGGRNELASISGYQARFFTYPYGNYSAEVCTASAQAGFEASFTTEPELVRSWSDKHALGRFMVKNWTGPEFEAHLSAWFNEK